MKIRGQRLSLPLFSSISLDWGLRAASKHVIELWFSPRAFARSH